MARPTALVVVPVTACLLFMAVPAWAAAPTSTTSTAPDTYHGDSREVVAVVLADWPPQYSLSPSGEPQGIAVDLIEAVADRAGVRIRYRIRDSFAEALDDLRTGRADLIPNLGITPERVRYLTFTAPLETFNLRLFVRAGSTFPRGWSDLEGRVVGVVQTNAAAEILARREGVDLEILPDIHSALFELLAGQVDALVYPEPVVWAVAGQAGLEGRIRAIGEPLVEIRRGIAVRPDLPELAGRLQRAVEDFVGSPEYEEIYASWYGRREPFWTSGRVLWAAIAALGIGLLAVLLWRYRIVIRFDSELRHQRVERRRAEQMAEESDTRLRAVADNLAEGLVIGDLDGRITYVNPRFEAMTGFRREECVGRHATELLHPGERPATVGENLVRRRDGVSESYETRLRTRDGGTLWVEIHASPFVDGSGEVVGALSAIVDITERKRAQDSLREREDQLRQVQRIEALGRLAGGIAHDFNNLLTAINGYGDLLLADLDADDPRRDHALAIRRAGESAASLTRQLLTFSRHRIHQPGVVDLDAAVRSVEPVLRRLIEESIEVVIETEATASTIAAEPSQLESVLLNLAINGRDAMADGGRLTVRTRTVEDLPELVSGSAAEADRWVVLEVEDTGTGMDERVRSQIFDPFFTTKAQGVGTGLGLASVYGIVKQSGGTVEVESEPGRGSLFRVFFPLAPPEDGVSERPSDGVSDPGEKGRPKGDGDHGVLLVVEDEAQVRNLVTLILRQRGYEVLTASCGEEAIRLVNGGADGAGGHRIDALITDMVMPGMGGEELAARLREDRPNLKVLFTSGYTEKGLTPDQLEAPDLDFLQKPFQAASLVRSVRALLEG